jgi:hypothetical protein
MSGALKLLARLFNWFFPVYAHCRICEAKLPRARHPMSARIAAADTGAMKKWLNR